MSATETGLPFRTDPPRLSPDDLTTIAADFGCEAAALGAVVDVESSGRGFLQDGRPLILFERHYFSRLTKRAHDRACPDISGKTWGGYGRDQWARMQRAMALDRPAALASASWGLFQVMGDHWSNLRYASIEEFAARMCQSEAEHLESFVRYVRWKKLLPALIARDWRTFACGYNGAAYAQNRYDAKMAAAYTRRHRGRPLQLGDKGHDVQELQLALGVVADGHFGPVTRGTLARLGATGI